MTLAVGILPAMLLNAWLLADLAEPAFDEPFPSAYMWWMLLLVLWEMPLVTALATLYLGEAVFLERPQAAAASSAASSARCRSCSVTRCCCGRC